MNKQYFLFGFIFFCTVQQMVYAVAGADFGDLNRNDKAKQPRLYTPQEGCERLRQEILDELLHNSTTRTITTCTYNFFRPDRWTQKDKVVSILTARIAAFKAMKCAQFYSEK